MSDQIIYVPPQSELDAFQDGFDAGKLAERERCAAIADSVRSELHAGSYRGKLNQIDAHVVCVVDGISRRIMATTT